MGNCQMLDTRLLFLVIFRIVILASTWNKDTHDLFDYESIDYQRQTFTMSTENIYITQELNNLKFTNDPPTQNMDVLLFISRNNILMAGTQQQEGNSTAISQTKFPFKIKKNWISVRSLGKYPLKKDDIFRLGRITFRIYDISFEANNDAELISGTNSEGNEQCRICLGSGSNLNPLINPCKCSGSLKYLHLECMKRWLKENTTASRSTEKSETYLWNQLQCEICKEFYKLIFQSDGTIYHMNELLKPKTPYIMLEYQSKKKDGSKQRQQGDFFTSKSDGIIVMSMGDDMNFGRARENWVRICDVSVSRFHATIKKDAQNQIYLQDNNSKFGSLVLIKEDLPIQHEIEIQVGRNLFKLQTNNLTC